MKDVTELYREIELADIHKQIGRFNHDNLIYFDYFESLFSSCLCYFGKLIEAYL